MLQLSDAHCGGGPCMRWLMDVCPNSLGWQTWLILCAVVVVLWAAAIASATALFRAAAPQRRSERREALEEPVHSGHAGAD
ncbi:hypothetical protein WN67_05665 [Mycolicibacterium obuense]|uniref:Transmembrane protein n=1 Tax=Mycolicibacterium obuense TaxID=1807 RepID=A0A0M2K700_9MYCO|nr:hypothetical protein WN67_05665 [Mycolicibacterium obuense]